MTERCLFKVFYSGGVKSTNDEVEALRMLKLSKNGELFLRADEVARRIRDAEQRAKKERSGEIVARILDCGNTES
jgi:hypothetical protein